MSGLSRRERARSAHRRSVGRTCRRLRREALDWLRCNRNRAWWTWDCSYPWVDLPNYLAAGVISLAEVIENVATDDANVREDVRGCLAANSSIYRGPGQARRSVRRRLAHDGPPCIASAIVPG